MADFNLQGGSSGMPAVPGVAQATNPLQGNVIPNVAAPAPAVPKPAAPKPAAAPAPAAPAPIQTYNFMNESAQVQNGKVIGTKPIVTAQPALQDLNTKQNFANDQTQIMTNQQANVSANKAAAAAAPPAPPEPTPTESPSGMTMDEAQAKYGGDLSMFNQNPDGTFTEKSPNDLLKDNMVAANNLTAQYQGQLTQLQNGTFPLTPAQQSQIDAMQQQFDQLVAQQKIANDNYIGVVTRSGIASGRSRYAPEIESGNIMGATNAGIAKIQQIETSAANSIAQMKQAFLDNDFKLIDAAYKAANDALSQKENVIKEIAQNVKDEAARVLAVNQDKRDQATFELKMGQTLSSPFGMMDSNTQSFLLREIEKYPDAFSQGQDFSQMSPSDIIASIQNSPTYKANLQKTLADAAKSGGLTPSDILSYASKMGITYQQALAQIQDSGVGGSTLVPGQELSGTSRTDRNNNPTAMTTDVAKSLGLVEGKDYTQGDPFQSGSGTLYTAKLIGDPIAVTIQGLDNAAQNGLGAFETASGKPRWSYIDMKDKDWLALSPDQKAEVVNQMYHQENGSGSSPTSQLNGRDAAILQQLTDPIDQAVWTGASSAMRATAEQLAEGALKWTARGLTKDSQKLQQLVQMVDPTWTQSNSDARYKYYTNYVANGATVRTRLNTAIDHLSILNTAMQNLKNAGLHGGWGPFTQQYNTIKNMLDAKSGDPRVQAYKTALQQFAPEIAGVYKSVTGNAAPTEQEILGQLDSAASMLSPQQFDTYIGTVLQQLTGRLTSMRDDFKSVMGKDVPFNLLEDTARKSLASMKDSNGTPYVDPNDIDPLINQSSDPSTQQSDQSIFDELWGGGQ